jgi:hypothetical protein
VLLLQDLDPWQQPNTDNGRPWIAPWGLSTSGGSPSAATNDAASHSSLCDSAGAVSSSVVLVVAIVCLILWFCAFVGGACGGWMISAGVSCQWPRSVWKWVKGGRGGKPDLSNRYCELESLRPMPPVSRGACDSGAV